jgi:hypothetical protein
VVLGKKSWVARWYTNEIESNKDLIGCEGKVKITASKEFAVPCWVER